LHYPAAFCAALLNAQPMGFWSPDTLVRDARRHGVLVRRPDVNHSDWMCTLEPDERSAGGVAVRLGVKEVRSVGEDLAKRVAEHRPYADLEDVVRRADVPLPAIEMLATAGAFRSLGHDRRSALWAAGATAQSRADRLAGIVTGVHAPPLPGMSDVEETNADLWSTGIAPEHHPVEHVRDRLRSLGVVTAADLRTIEPDERVVVGGVVTHRQRPATASGTVFVNLEDETGLINVICSPGLWKRYRLVARTSPAMLVRGKLERADGVTNVVADRLEPLPLMAKTKARDFR
jgi:error-prone DNA polymerase